MTAFLTFIAYMVSFGLTTWVAVALARRIERRTR